ncbi:unnamed protein product [Linum tenue]|uniref:peroxidase n=1 Tax=Linum tenue TaxID=586396 RepID=A0AAV0J3E6_9ROSI|nr:unnamed protein product [Linum tenue]
MLDSHYYDQTCPQAEAIILQTVRNASIYDPKGCDASILLDTTTGNQAEKDGPPNSGGPSWDVLKGRKDGRVSKASDTINRALGVKDLVALSGGHTLGFSHCSSFQNRIRNFSSMHDVDPNMNLQLAEVLRKKCRKPHTDRSAGTFLDSTSSIFDNEYFRQLTQGKGVFGSDQALFIDDNTKSTVEAFAKDQSLFFGEFAASMVKLGNVGVIEKGEVRLKCASVN